MLYLSVEIVMDSSIIVLKNVKINTTDFIKCTVNRSMKNESKNINLLFIYKNNVRIDIINNLVIKCYR
jgi:hypothetical protein